MPQIEKSKVQILLNLGLAKATADYSRDGFGKLADAIQAPIITKRYIDERIYQQLKKNDNEPFISLKIEYLNEIAAFTGFSDFLDYETKYVSIGKALKDCLREEVSIRTIIVVVDKNNLNFCQEKLEQVILKNQTNFLTYISVNFEKLQYCEVEEHIDPDDSSVTLFLLNTDLIEANDPLLKQIASANQEHVNAIPVWIDPPQATKEDALGLDWLLLDDIDLIIQFLLTGSAVGGKKDSMQKNNKTSTTNINNSGTVNLGKIGKIKAEYISSRDMHININKSEN